MFTLFATPAGSKNPASTGCRVLRRRRGASSPLVGYRFVVILGICLFSAAVSVPSAVLASQASTPQPESAVASTQPAIAPPLNGELDELVALITRNNTPEARELGARNVLSRGSPAAARRLADILKDSTDLPAKQAICRAIAAYGAPNHSAAHPNVSDAGASVTLADVGLPAEVLAGPLLGMLGDHGRELDEEIVLALRRFESTIVIPRLEALAKGGERRGNHTGSPESGNGQSAESLVKQESAIRALGFMGDELQAVGVLVGLLGGGPGTGEQDPTEFAAAVRIRIAVLDAIAQATGVQHRNAASARAWWEAHRSMSPLQWLQDVNARRIDQINQLRTEKDLLTQRLVGAYRDAYLQTAEAQRPRKLLAFLSDESIAVRGLGLDLINAMITDRKDVGPEIKARLVEMFQDGDSQIRRRVAVMVGDLRQAGAVTRLVESFAVEEDYDVRAAQVAALGRLDDESAVPVLIASLDGEAPEVVREAALALGTLARKGHADPQVVEAVVTALMQRFSEIPEPGGTDRAAVGGDPVARTSPAGSSADAENLREHFIEAMRHIGDERFRAVFRRSLDPRHSLRTRRAAIAAMGSYRDVAAAEELREYVSATEPELRLAAVQALGRCGREQADLDALIRHLDSSQESNVTVRDRAWDSYQAIVQRMSPSSQLGAAANFARPGDLPSQRRRLSLLRALNADEQRLAALSTLERSNLLEAVVDAQFELGQYEAAANYLEKTLRSPQEVATTSAPSDDQRILVIRLMTALLKAGRDRDAVALLKECGGRSVVNGSNNPGSTLPLTLDSPGLEEAAQVFLGEARSRLAAAGDAAQFSAVFELVKPASPVMSSIAPAVAQQLAGVRREAMAQRAAVVSRLLNAAPTSPESEPQLLAFGAEIVVPEVLTRLEEQSATTNSDAGMEMRLVDLARKLVPAWPGYAPDCPAPEREAALAALRQLQQGAKAQPETMPSSAPGRP
jgi:HEAT repeat protein